MSAVSNWRRLLESATEMQTNHKQVRDAYFDGYGDGWSDAERSIKLKSQLPVPDSHSRYGMWALLALFLAGCAGLVLQIVLDLR